jgi:hypothetical protein
MFGVADIGRAMRKKGGRGVVRVINDSRII